MRFLRPILLAALMLSGATLHAQTAGEIVGKYLEAIGGEEAWKGVTTLKATGHIRSAGPDIAIILTAVHMKGFRSEYTALGEKGYSVVTPTAGWYYNGRRDDTAATVTFMSSGQVRLSQAQLDIQGELVDYKAKGHKVAYAGPAEVDGKSCYLLKLTAISGATTDMYIDKSTHYLIRTVSKAMVDGEESQDTINYSKYETRKGGLVYPMQLGTATGDIMLSAVDFNAPIDPKLFEPGS